MSEDKERLTRVETEIGFLKEAFGEVKTALLQLAGDMHVLALADAERTEDRRTFERIARQIEDVNAETRRLWARGDEIVAAHAAAEQKRVADALAVEQKRNEESRKEKNKWLWELIRTGLTMAASFFLFKLGIHPL